MADEERLRKELFIENIEYLHLGARESTSSHHQKLTSSLGVQTPVVQQLHLQQL